ncbi:MAG: hypothetical protein H0X29_06970 [Parachlamydiaceae bacterium]|nr:hypothetical protein [Parachlamydiaceae bacterium]
MPRLTEMKTQPDVYALPSSINFSPSGKMDIFDNPIHQLDVSKLQKNRIYLIFCEAHEATFKVIDWLRDVVFLDNKDRYTLEKKTLNGVKFCAFSINQSDIDICKRTAELFDLTCKPASQSAVLNKKSYFIPRSEQILAIRPKYISENKKFTVQEKESVESFGKSFSYSRLD